MNAKLSMALVGCMALLLSAFGSNPQSLIVGKWEVAGAKVGGAEVLNAGAVKSWTPTNWSELTGCGSTPCITRGMS